VSYSLSALVNVRVILETEELTTILIKKCYKLPSRLTSITDCGPRVGVANFTALFGWP
jgi:hypothetical protein